MRNGEQESRKKLPFVSVIIPVFNDAARLQVCLEALDKQSYPGDLYEVIVVDNASDETIIPIVGRYTRARAGFERRSGSYSARNMGVSLANGEVIGFTDSDCIPSCDWIERGVTSLLRHENCGIIGGKVELFFKKKDRPTAVELFDKVTFFQQEFYVEHYRFSVTANLFTFRKVFDHVGPFDGTRESGGDTEWGQRVFAHGYRVIYAPDVRVSHPARHSFRHIYNKVVRLASGVHKSRGGADHSLVRFGARLLRELVPPRTKMLMLWSDKRLNGNKQRIGVCFVKLLLHYVEIWEEIRLQLRDLRRRS